MTAFVHVPRTGGLALTEALRGTGVRADGHLVRPGPGEDSITILRDPVARFVSCCALKGVDAEAMARDPDAGGWFFQPASRWLDGLMPVWVGRTETLAQDVERLRAVVPGMGALPAGHNASCCKSTLSPGAEARVRHWYAEDYDLLERLA